MSAAYVMQRLKGFDELDHVVGIDPDLHTSALCFWTVGMDTPFALRVARAPKEFRGQNCATRFCGQRFFSMDLAVIEGQRFRKAKGHETKNAQSLIDLATVTGVFAGRPEFGETLIVEPSTWKGSVPKQVHQARVLSRIPGTAYKLVGSDASRGYCLPVTGPLVELGKAAGLKKSDWKHVVDAIGIAQWAIMKIKEFEKRRQLT